MKLRIVSRFFGIVLFMGAACVFAEPPAEKLVQPQAIPALYQSGKPGGKTAYVDMALLFNEYPGTKPAMEVLQNEMKQKMPGRQALTAELEQIAKEGHPEAIQAQWQKIQLYDKQVQSDLDARQTEIFTPVFESIEASVKAFGAKKGYQAIYVEPHEGALDVTAEVLKGLK